MSAYKELLVAQTRYQQLKELGADETEIAKAYARILEARADVRFESERDNDDEDCTFCE